MIGPSSPRPDALLDFEEHMFHRLWIAGRAFVRCRLAGYLEQMDRVVSRVVVDWVVNAHAFRLSIRP